VTENAPARELQVFLVSPDADLRDMLEGLSLPFEARWHFFDSPGAAVDRLLNAPPDLLLVDGPDGGDAPALDGRRLVEMVKGENVYRSTPVILVLDPEALDLGPDWTRVQADDFLLRQPGLPVPGAPGAGLPGLAALPLDPVEAAARIALTVARARRTQDTNPLTLLPGNTSIMQAVQARIDARELFALGYADLDHFKAFNDKYGFARGDEVLRMAARLLVNTVRQAADATGFVGHVGGDDFVFAVPAAVARPVCERFIAAFDAIVPGFYDADDRARGAIASRDRGGNPCTFPLMAVSIAVVVNHDAKLVHYGEASSIASELKKRAKATPGSSYVLDRRRT